MAGAPIERLERRVRYVLWMTGAALALDVAILLKLLVHP